MELQKTYIFRNPSTCMDFSLIPVLRDDIHVSQVKTPEGRKIVVYISSKGTKITPNDATVQLLLFCDGMHTLAEIVSHFVKAANEERSTIEEDVEKIVERLEAREVIELCDTFNPRAILPEVELIHPLESIVLEITDACNLKCIHCYNDSGNKRRNELTLEEIYKLIDEAKRIGVLRVNVSGGEPLMHPYFFEIAEYIRDCTLGLELFTNGTLVTRDCARKLKDLNILKVSLSLDSLNHKIHDSFRGKKGAWEKTMAGIQNLKLMGVRIEPAVSLSQRNMKEVIPLCEFFFKEGFTTYRFMAVIATGRETPLEIGITPADLEEAYKKILVWQKNHGIQYDSLGEIKGMNCGIGSELLVIKSDGDVAPCSPFGRRIILGNTRDQSLHTIWNDSPLLNVLRNLDARNHPVCSTCRLLNFCRGGCIANVYTARGELQMHDPFSCAYRRAQEYVEETT